MLAYRQCGHSYLFVLFGRGLATTPAKLTATKFTELFHHSVDTGCRTALFIGLLDVVLSEQYLPGTPGRCYATPHKASHDNLLLLSAECHTGMCHLLPWRLWGRLSRTAPCSCSATMTSSMRSSSSRAISLRYTFLLCPKAVHHLVFVFITQHSTCLYLGSRLQSFIFQSVCSLD